jgi:hypothetical protein
MTPGRSNGLPAARYTPLVDLEPHFADALLEALRDEGVPAYAAPSPGRRGPYLDIQLPDRPTDRVWVDVETTARAREILRERMPEFSETVLEPSRVPILTDAQSDAAWQAIVAGFDTTAPDPVPPWPVAEDVPAETVPTEDGAMPRREDSPLGSGWLEITEIPRPAPPPEDPEEHFVPPPPPPLPRIEARTKLAWLGVLCGPLYLLMRGWFDLYFFYGDEVLALGAFIAGSATLIYRMKDDRHDGSGPDDGAVV